MAYVDAHCHLGSRQYDDDRNEMIDRMLGARVSNAIIICCGMHDLLRGAPLRDSFEGFKLAMGIHPQDLEDDRSEERLISLRKAIEAYRPEMIGEIGLDYYSHPHTKEDQKIFFHAQLKLAEELDLPINVHSRKAPADTLEILKQHHCRGIIHSYSGSIEMARLYMKEGYYISFGASMLFPGSKKPQQVISQMPLDRLLIETDSPFQSPLVGHRHEPCDVVRIYEAISRIKGISMEELERIVEENFNNVFNR